MNKLVFSEDFFNIEDTLNCGQVFRFMPFKQGFLSFFEDNAVYCYNDSGKAILEFDCDQEKVKKYFDIERDYSDIYNSAIDFGGVLSTSAKIGKGIRILNQNKTESLFSFIISQNNNIPRIKGIIERLSSNLGEKKSFMGVEYHAFPTTNKMAEKDVDFYKGIGLGYRADYIYNLAKSFSQGFDIERFNNLSTADLKKSLLKIYGVGPKVADCVSLFGFHRTDSFPVDTWIEKVYREDFKGELTDRNKITEYFTNTFKENSGYFQQYLFYYKRSKEVKG